MSKIKIITDSSSDISLSVAEELGITVIPIKFTFGDKTYRDKFDMDMKEFYETIRNSEEIPKTTQITPLEFEECFREEAKDCDEIIAILLSGNSSGTFRNANLAKNIVEDETDVKIHLFDSLSFSYCYGHLCVVAAKMAKEGKSSEEILSKLSKINETQQVYFAVETLDYLKKGGRIKTTTAVIGGILDIRPILTIKDGLVASIDKVKGEKKLYSKLVEYISGAVEEIGENAKIYTLASDTYKSVDIIRNMLEEKGYTVEPYCPVVGATIGSHAGPGVYGILITVD